MSRTFRQLSSTLALVMLLTTVINTVLVMCTSGSDHHAFELIGHQEQFDEHAALTLDASAPVTGHDAHPDICTDTPLLSDIPLQQNNLVPGCGDKLHQAYLVYPLDNPVAPVSAFDSLAWPSSLHAASMRPPTDDLSSIRLLI